MSKKNISTMEVADPSVGDVTGIADGTVEVSNKNASEPVSDSVHSGERWEHNVWKALLEV